MELYYLESIPIFFHSCHRLGKINSPEKLIYICMAGSRVGMDLSRIQVEISKVSSVPEFPPHRRQLLQQHWDRFLHHSLYDLQRQGQGEVQCNFDGGTAFLL